MRLDVRVTLACLVSVLTFVPINATEYRTVMMEVLAVKEVEVCPGGYASGDCHGADVLKELDRLKEDSEDFLQTYELKLGPQDDVETEELEITNDMMYALAPGFGHTPLDLRYAGLIVIYLGGRFKAVTIQECENIDTRSPRLPSDTPPRIYDVKDLGRWYYHCRGKSFLPIAAVEWNIQLDDSTIVFKFVRPGGQGS